MYYRVANQVDPSPLWQWKSTAMTGKLLLTYRGHSSEAWEVSWSPDGKLIA